MKRAGHETNYNRWTRRIKIALALTKQDVKDILSCGGIEVSSSRAEGLTRSASDRRRFSPMREDEFEAFTSGLVDWARDNIK